MTITIIAINPMTRAIDVDMATPATPRTGKPNKPKITTKFPAMFKMFMPIVTNIVSFV
ncbi:hypothetical protein [Bacillus sp. S1(2024)]|uniref:hypothetical protein n=1 Tax=Bacillus sp. S1(2024) TaxID=3111910 RepID=UPI003FA5C0E6